MKGKIVLGLANFSELPLEYYHELITTLNRPDKHDLRELFWHVEGTTCFCRHQPNCDRMCKELYKSVKK